MNKQEKIEELLTRGVDEVIDRKHLEQKLKSGKKLRVKLGIDPTSPNIHLGRSIPLLKLRDFQELGHQVVFIVGDFTGIIGDTSDKDSERPMLTENQIKQNLKTYFSQAFLILDKKRTEVYYNSKWLKKLGFMEIGHMANAFGLHEFEARENISKRLKAGKRVSLRELLYPLMQGYDSVAVKSDIELGGTDQRFNLLAGREIQKLYKQEPQDIITNPLMEGTDGRKMSSSWGNVINLTDTPNDMFGKAMSIPDSLIEKYFMLATRVSVTEIKTILKLANPRDQKEQLALAITEMYHGTKSAQSGRDNFVAQFRNKEKPQDIPTYLVKAGSHATVDLLVSAKLAASKSEARRLLEQNGVKANDKPAPTNIVVGKEAVLLQVGKRKFLNIKAK